MIISENLALGICFIEYIKNAANRKNFLDKCGDSKLHPIVARFDAKPTETHYESHMFNLELTDVIAFNHLHKVTKNTNYIFPSNYAQKFVDIISVYKDNSIIMENIKLVFGIEFYNMITNSTYTMRLLNTQRTMDIDTVFKDKVCKFIETYVQHFIN